VATKPRPILLLLRVHLRLRAFGPLAQPKTNGLSTASISPRTFSRNFRPSTVTFGATLYVRHVGSDREILVETYWRSLDAIHMFAGVDLETAVVADEVVTILTDYDHQVRHYEIVLSDCGPAASAPTA